MNNTLQHFRQQLDTIDEQIAKLLDERMKITDQVGIYKREHSLPPLDASREQAIIENLKKHITHPLLKETIGSIYQQLFYTSRSGHYLKQHQDLPFNKIGVLGLGLIGGSFIKVLKSKQPAIHIATLHRTSKNNHIALEQGYIDEQYTTLQDMANQVDLIVIASPIESVHEYAKAIACLHLQRQNKLIVIDVASVKEHIAKEFETVSNEYVEFVATHPMAGSDKVGFEHAKATMFINRPWVITPHHKNHEDTIGSIKKLIHYVGSNPTILTPHAHDQYAAVVSHLVFLISTYIFAYPSESTNQL
jgi:prephenate dehydrogenase/chorismate mutase